MQLIYKYFKKQVIGKSFPDPDHEGCVDYIALMDDDFNKKLEKYIHKDEVAKYQCIMDAPELSYVFVKDTEDGFVEVTEEEYETFKEANIEEYV